MSVTAPSTPLVVKLPTPYGHFDAHAFERPSGFVYLALVYGNVSGEDDVLVRVHSECLTGDALGSLRCDCGVQLRQSLRMIAASGQGVLIYATGHEGRGIGLVNKLRAYVAQEEGADTVDANHLLGLPADARDYGDAAAVVNALGIGSIRLMTNNPAKVRGLSEHGITINDVVGLATVAHRRNARYLTTKAERMGHVRPTGVGADATLGDDIDPAVLIGDVRARPDRPAVVVKLAQSLDGRIATASGDSKWISSDEERRLSHALRAACDAVLVGAGTVVQDDPLLTVREVPGASPIRVVVDSGLRVPLDSQLFGDDGSTLVLTTAASDPEARDALRNAGAGVEVVAADRDGRVDLHAGLARLREMGMEVVLVEGGATLVTALLAAELVDRLIVSVAPLVIGAGTDAVGELGTQRVADAVTLTNRTVATAGDDIVIAGDVTPPAATEPGFHPTPSSSS
jgi:3,4-dihydroxy 2-butanone 4-phosphate synthase/GTP cyclohydrolase II